MKPCDAIRSPEDAIAFTVIKTIAELKDENRRLYFRVWLAFVLGLLIGILVK